MIGPPSRKYKPDLATPRFTSNRAQLLTHADAEYCTLDITFPAKRGRFSFGSWRSLAKRACFGCKRSRVQISAARPNSSKSCWQGSVLDPQSGDQLESKH